MLPRRCPAWRWREPDLGFCMERVNLCSDSEVERTGRDLERETPSGRTVRGRVPMRSTGADRPVVAVKPGNAGGAKGAGYPDE
jgi:hypothetical protein